MERAKAAVNDFLHKDGKTDTTVHEKVNPAVQHENITPTRHENVTKAVDREVHQDHYHTTVQPVKDREVNLSSVCTRNQTLTTRRSCRRSTPTTSVLSSTVSCITETATV